MERLRRRWFQDYGIQLFEGSKTKKKGGGMGNAEREGEQLSEKETLGPKVDLFRAEKRGIMEVRRGPDEWWTGRRDRRCGCTGRDGGRNRREDWT